MASRGRIWLKLILTLALAVQSRGGEPSALSPVVIDIAQTCAVVADGAVPWLRHRSVEATGPDHCGDQTPCYYSLTASKLRSAHGNFIFNATGRYVKGGRWYSMLTAPNVSSWEGEMVLTPKSRQACALALSFVFQTTISEFHATSYYDEKGGRQDGAGDFESAGGPLVQSNRRLEREYGQAIATRVGRLRASPVTSKPTRGQP